MLKKTIWYTFAVIGSVLLVHHLVSRNTVHNNQLPLADNQHPIIATKKLNPIDELVTKAINEQKTPGAVVLVGHKGNIIYQKAFGKKSLEPHASDMTIDTIFDIASLTKPLVTATAIALLTEQKKITFTDHAAQHLKNFGSHNKSEITIEHLLTHRSGLTAANHLNDYRDGKEEALNNICKLELLDSPGERMIYSDVGYIVLGELVERISGMPLDQFASDYIFNPLGMQHTYYRPHPMLWTKIAPNNRTKKGKLIHGRVHDPRAHLLGGVAGNAGVFSTASDIAIFCQMILNKGIYGGNRILSEKTITQMTSPGNMPIKEQRGLGWDIDTKYSSPRGKHFPVGRSFGHTGYTGSSIWIDPTSETFVIILTNRLHPDKKGKVGKLRSAIATVVGKAV